MRDIIDNMMTVAFIALFIALFLFIGYTGGMHYAIEKLTVKQQGNFIICEIDGIEWKTIMEVEEW